MNKHTLLMVLAIACHAQTGVVVERTPVPSTPPVSTVAYALRSEGSKDLGFTNIVLECSDDNWIVCTDVLVSGKDPSFWKSEQVAKDGKKVEVISILVSKDLLRSSKEQGLLIELRGVRSRVKVTLPDEFVVRVSSTSTSP